MENFSEFLPLISGALGGAASVGLFKGPIQTLEDWWYVNFGYEHANNRAELIAKQEANVEKLKNGILDNAVKIDPSNIQEPQLKILGPALEASKYYIEEEELREMFAKLIASSLDASKNDVNHSSYVEIIKQLSPIDAKILFEVHKGNNAIAQIGLDFKIGFKITTNHVFVPNSSNLPDSLIEASIDNLIRLGLVNIDYGTFRQNDSYYDELRSSLPYQAIEELVRNLGSVKTNQNQNDDSIPHPGNLKGVKFIKGLVTTTKYGSNFCKVCLPN